MRKLALILSLMTVLGLAACAEPAQEGPVGLANPFREHATLAEAMEAVSLPMEVPAVPEGWEETAIRSMAGEHPLIEVLWHKGDSRLTLRKGAGDADVSGDYNDYPETRTADWKPDGVKLKGKDGLLFHADWTEGGYAFAIVSDEGLTEETMQALVTDLN